MKLPLCAVGALLTLTVIGCTTPAQLFRDAHLDKLCAIDGGLHVYHKQPSHLRNAVAELLKPPRDNDLYTIKSSTSTLDGAPSGINYMWRTAIGLYRISDNLLVAEHISYARRGWDLLRPHPSAYGCPVMTRVEEKMLNAVFGDGEK